MASIQITILPTETEEPMIVENKEVVETPNSVVETQEPTTQDSTLPIKYGNVMIQEPCEIIELNEEAHEETKDIPLLKY